MKIVTKVYICDVCGKTGEWSKEWCAHLFPFGLGYTGWEHEFHLCSEWCDRKILNMTKTDRLKLLPSPPAKT